MMFSISAILTFLASCSSDVINPAPIVNERVELPAINAISTESMVNVIIKEGSEQSVTVIGTDDLISKVDLDVVDGLLKVDYDQDGGTVNVTRLEVEVVLPAISKLTTNSSGNIDVQGFGQLDQLLVEVKGAGNVHINGPVNVANALNVLVDGSGSVKLEGTTSLLDVAVEGPGSIRAFDLDAKDVVVTVTASGTSEVKAESTLDVRISGSGHVHYKGAPSITKEISGSGQLINAN